MSRPSHIYLLPTYANTDNLETHRSAQRTSSQVRYQENDKLIELQETNSLVENFYSMNIHAASYTLKGTISSEAMIHQHPQGHQDRHLQFKLKSFSLNKTIRIYLRYLDEEDFQRCIKGFLYGTKQIIAYEQEELALPEDIEAYFFNEKVNELKQDYRQLLEHIEQARDNDEIRDDTNESVSTEDFASLRAEPHLLPFLNFRQQS